MIAEVPEIGSRWHFPRWTNPKWMGPWRVTRVGPATPESEWGGVAVFVEREDGPPESWTPREHEVALEQWDGWEPWPEVPDFPPA